MDNYLKQSHIHSLRQLLPDILIERRLTRVNLRIGKRIEPFFNKQPMLQIRCDDVGHLTQGFDLGQ